MAGDRKFYGWILVAALWVIYFINGPFPMVGGSVINVYMIKELGIDRTTLGLGFTLMSLFMGLPAGLIAFCINKKGIRLTLFIGSLILVLGTVLMALAVSRGWHYVLIFGIILGAGIGFGSVMPVQTGITFWFKKKRALAMSIVLTAGGMGGFVAAPLLNRIIVSAEGNWRIAWLSMAGMSLFAAFLSLLFVRNRPEDLGQIPDGIGAQADGWTSDPSIEQTNRVHQTGEDWKIKDILRTTTIWIIFLAGIGFIVPWMTCLAHGVLHLKDVGIGTDDAAMAIGYLLFFSILGRLMGGFLGDRVEPRIICGVGLFFQMAGVLFLIKAGSMGMVYLFAIFLGTGFGATFVCLPTMSGNYFGAEIFASLQGILYPINIVFGAVAPYLAGWLYDKQGSYDLAFYTGAAMAGAAGVLLFFAKPPRLPAQAVEDVLTS
jgi:MFS family permease